MVRTVLATLLLSAACSAASADQGVYGPQPIAAAKVRAPFDVQVLRESGEALPTYASRGRFYVQGNASERYIIKVSNPTARRVEAVVSVDGLDVIDGEAGDLRKRGYVIPPYGETRIEGFRTSQSDVATFRFGSVDGSYAGRKGKARNVGVIAVAIFEEKQVEPQEIVGDAAPYRQPARRRPAYPAPATGAAERSEAKRAPAAPTEDAAGSADAEAYPPPPPAPPPSVRQPTQRPGLGTEFGEERYSAVSFTRFERAGGRPIAIAELRYNNAAGLMALGIAVEPQPDEGEIMTRETADPFPGDRFARPPR